MIIPHLKSRIHEDISVLLEFDNHSRTYLLDCGVASDLSVADCVNLEAIFITHTHIDHFSNFDQVMRHQIGLGRTVVICGPVGIAQQVSNKMKGFTWNLLKPGNEKNVIYEVREIHSEGEIQVYRLEAPEWEPTLIDPDHQLPLYTNEKFKVSFALLDHGIPTVAYRFDEHSSIKINMQECPHRPGPWVRELKMAYQAQDRLTHIKVGEESMAAGELFYLLEEVRGASFGFIMDHAASNRNHALITRRFFETDEVWIEAFFTEIEAELALKNNHSTAKASGAVCRHAKVKKAVPVHYSRRYHEEAELEVLKREFYGAFEGE